MWTCLVATLLTQTAATPPPALTPTVNPSLSVAVLRVARQGSVPPELGAMIADALRTSIDQAGLTAIDPSEVNRRLAGRDPSQCETNRTCYALLGEIAGVPWVVRFEAGAVESDVVVVLQAISSRDGSLGAETNLQTTTAAISAGLTDALRPFAEKVRVAAQSSDPFVAAPKLADAPTRAELTTPLPGADMNGADLATRAPPPMHSRTPAYFAAGGTVVAAGATAALVAVGASASSCLNGPVVNGHPTVCVPQSEAPAVLQRANASYSGAAVSGAVSLALAAATIWLWDHSGG